MSKNTPSNFKIRDLLAQINLSNDQLFQILQQAGIQATDLDSPLSPEDKTKLLSHLRKKTQLTSTEQSIPKKRFQSHSTLAGIVGGRKTVKVTSIQRKSFQPQIPPIENVESSVQDLPAKDALEVAEDKKLEPLVSNTSSDLQPIDLTIEQGPPFPTHRAQGQDAEPKKKGKEHTKSKRNKFQAELDKTEWLEGTEDLTPPLQAYPSNKPTNQVTTSSKAVKKTKGSTPKVIEIPNTINVIDLAKKMAIHATEVMEHLLQISDQADYYQALDQETATFLVEAMGHIPKPVIQNAAEIEIKKSIAEQMGPSLPRPPIVTIMGHVDHGKTSLLDYIRKSKITAKEAGGITQHIGAYYVKTNEGGITFLDTPGHAAFTAMRARGANLTDIVVLIVAGDDGVKPQTIEAIQHAKAANVPIVAAISKMDKGSASLERVKQELAQHDILPEDWGGDTIVVPISVAPGKEMGIFKPSEHGEGSKENCLLEALLLQAEVAELTAPIKGPAQGLIIESKLDKGQGPVATLIVQKGTLKKGDIVLAGTSFGRVRALQDEQGKQLQEATPSIPVQILGLSKPPAAGEEAFVVPNERKAREIAQMRINAERESKLKQQSSSFLEAFMKPVEEEHKTLTILLKADVQGSVEALQEALIKLSTPEVTIKLVMSGVGTITESDVNLAIASKAVMLGFNVSADNTAKRLIQRENIKVYYHSIIYELLDEIQKVIQGVIGPQFKETTLGKAIVRALFGSRKTGVVAGCQVTEGNIQAKLPIRILRQNKLLYEGKIESLRRFKDTVTEVHSGTECGISIPEYSDIQIGDIVESYERIKIN
jgi:translation initiation factor IF-2